MRSRTRNVLAAGLVVAGLAFAPLTNAQLFEGQRGHGATKATMAASELLRQVGTDSAPAECDDEAGEVTIDGVTFECQLVDFLSYTPGAEILATPNTDVLTGGGLSDIWGWTSPETGDEYVIVGATTGAAALRVTDPTNPEYLGHIFNTGAQLVWFDVKVNNDHAYVVTESAAAGMKIFDLTQLDGMSAVEPGTTMPLPAVTFPMDLTAHNVVVNEESDRLYLVGSSMDGVGTFQVGSNSSIVCQAAGTASGNTLDNNGLFAFDISDPTLPVPLGCHGADGYVHDAHCVTYAGPDTEHEGKEICLAAHEEGVSVVDITDPLAPVTLSDTTDEDYPKAAYSHQGWLGEDQEFFFHGDELDEQDHGIPTRTFVFDVRDLDDIALHFINEPGGKNIDHNMYTHRGLLFQSNYAAGLQIFDTTSVDEPVLDGDGTTVANGSLPMVAEFDIHPDDLGFDPAEFAGTWSNYPYFDSGTLAVTTYDGLFLLRLDPELAAQHPIPGEDA